jgi:hypothetical protein
MFFFGGRMRCAARAELDKSEGPSQARGDTFWGGALVLACSGRKIPQGRGEVRVVGVVHRRPDGSGVEARTAARSKRTPARAAGLSVALSLSV